MTRIYHSEIFYPLNINFNSSNFVSIDNPKFLVLPHASYKYIQATLDLAFNSIKNNKFEQIIILGSMHRPFLDIDKNCLLATRPAGKIEFGNSSIQLTSLNEPNVAVNESYFIEESNIELPLPYLAHYFSNIPVLQILAYTYSEKLEQIITKYKDKNNLFIIMDNFKVDISKTQDNDYIIDNAISGIWLKSANCQWKVLKDTSENLHYCLLKGIN